MIDDSFAITGKGYVIVAADMATSQSTLKVETNEGKSKSLVF